MAFLNITRQTRLKIVIVLTTIMFLGEIIFGYITHSIALVTDSFHMLSDIAAMVIAHYAISLSQRKSFDSERYTFGWQRAETLGALVNSVFLLALCFTIFLTAIQRFFEPVIITQPLIVLIVGSVGLCVNLIGILLFHNAHHELDATMPVIQTMPVIHADDGINANAGGIDVENLGNLAGVQQQQQHHHSLNMKGAFLHVLGDALGSVGVIISAVVIKWSNWRYSYYMDPAVSILISAIIIFTTWKLFSKTSNILLHVVPPSISISNIRRDIMTLSDVEDLHELHVWQLSDYKIIASVHVILKNGIDQSDYMRISDRIKKILHVHSIHSTTVQLETIGEEHGTQGRQEIQGRHDLETDREGDSAEAARCQLLCKDSSCQTVTCCD